MKKLLVILLLLFPVHGAWAKKIHLICNIDMDSAGIATAIFVVDFKNNKLITEFGNKYPAYITDTHIRSDVPEKFLTSTILAKTSYFIHRHTGKISMTSTFRDGAVRTKNGKCEKSSGKRKF